VTNDAGEIAAVIPPNFRRSRLPLRLPAQPGGTPRTEVEVRIQFLAALRTLGVGTWTPARLRVRPRFRRGTATPIPTSGPPTPRRRRGRGARAVASARGRTRRPRSPPRRPEAARGSRRRRRPRAAPGRLPGARRPPTPRSRPRPTRGRASTAGGRSARVRSRASRAAPRATDASPTSPIGPSYPTVRTPPIRFCGSERRNQPEVYNGVRDHTPRAVTIAPRRAAGVRHIGAGPRCAGCSPLAEPAVRLTSSRSRRPEPRGSTGRGSRTALGGEE